MIIRSSPLRAILKRSIQNLHSERPGELTNFFIQFSLRRSVCTTRVVKFLQVDVRRELRIRVRWVGVNCAV